MGKLVALTGLDGSGTSHKINKELGALQIPFMHKKTPHKGVLFYARAMGFEPTISSVTGRRLEPGWTTPAGLTFQQVPMAGIEPATHAL